MIDFKVKTKTTVRDMGEEAILREIESIGKSVSITSGIHMPEGGQLPRYRGNVDGQVPIAVYADWQEHGNQRIPARPFLRPALDRETKRFLRQTATGMRKIYNGTGTVKSMMKLQAKRIRVWNRQQIMMTTEPPNSQKTLRTKRRKGRGSHPLIHSRSMYNSISSKVHYPGRFPDRRLRKILKTAEKTMRRLK